MDPLFTKYKYQFGELTTKSKFEGINAPDAGVEGNVVAGNGKYIAVSKFVYC